MKFYPNCDVSMLNYSSDFEPKGEVAKKYGVYRNHDGMTERALFVIDSNGVIWLNYISSTGVNPGAEGIPKGL